jgi:hypothetical protein
MLSSIYPKEGKFSRVDIGFRQISHAWFDQQGKPIGWLSAMVLSLGHLQTFPDPIGVETGTYTPTFIWPCLSGDETSR